MLVAALLPSRQRMEKRDEERKDEIVVAVAEQAVYMLNV